MRYATPIAGVFIAAIAMLCASCSTQIGISGQGFVFQGTIADVRVGWKYGKAADVEIEQSKEAASPQFMEALPAIVSDAVRVALVCADIGSAESIAKLAASCAIPERRDSQ